MKLEPRHNWIEVIMPTKEEKKESFVVLPDDYSPAEKPYRSVIVAKDPQKEYKAGETLVVPAHIIREVEIDELRFHLIERNHVMAVLR